MSGPVFGEWINRGTESLRPACTVGSGKISVASVCFERQIQLTDRKSLVIESNGIRTGSVAGHYWKEAVSIERKAMAVDREGAYRTKMTPERCSSIMIEPSEIEVEMKRIFSQSAQSVRKPVLGVLSVKRLTVQDGRSDGDPDYGMIEEMLREIEEFDESHRLSDEYETIIDALLEELEFENADQDGGERSEFHDVEEVPVPCTGVYKVSVECTCDVTMATGRSETDIQAEGKCSVKSTEADCSHERHYCQNPNEVIPQRPVLTCCRRLWVAHRKRGRRKTAEQQRRFPVSCWAPHRKRGKWKTQFNPRDTRRPQQKKRARLRSRCQLKSRNREDSNACPPDDAAMYVKLHPPNI